MKPHDERARELVDRWDGSHMVERAGPENAFVGYTGYGEELIESITALLASVEAEARKEEREECAKIVIEGWNSRDPGAMACAISSRAGEKGEK